MSISELVSDGNSSRTRPKLFQPNQDIHLIQAWGSPDEILNSKRTYKKVSSGIVVAMGLTILSHPKVFQYPGGVGLSYRAWLSESEISGHTWPEQSYLNYVLHTCKSGIDFTDLEEVVKTLTLAAKVSKKLIYSSTLQLD